MIPNQSILNPGKIFGSVLIVFLTGLIVITGCSKQKKYSEVIYLKKDSIEIGILPEVGGRLVSLKLHDGQNFIKSDSTLWREDISTLPEPGDTGNHKQYLGHINWVGPQSEWWINQDIHTNLRDKKSGWPPDPYLIYGNYEITDQSSRHITLKGPESAYSQIRFDKEYRITENNNIILKTAIINTSDKNVSWDSWFNTRTHGLKKCYVPAKKENCRFDVMATSKDDSLTYNFTQGYFYFNRNTYTKPGNELKSKAFIFPEQGHMAVFSNKEMLLVLFEKYDINLTHPQQGMVEIYNQITESKENCLLEVEYHSPYKTMNPGEQFSSQIEWKLYAYSGENSPGPHIAFLKKILVGK